MIILRRDVSAIDGDKIMQKFRVLRPHEGDRFYLPGEIREGDAREFKHLIPNVLEPLDGSAAQAAQVDDEPGEAAEGQSGGGLAAEGASESEATGSEKSLPAAPENKADKPWGKKAKTGARG